MNEPIIIVGAGVSGLRAAALLTAKGIPCRVLEARSRIGGRVLSEPAGDGPDTGMYDLGPTWFWPDHETYIQHLISELGIPVFEQHAEGALLFEQTESQSAERHVLPEGAIEKSMRIEGGVQTLIDAVAETLPEGMVELHTLMKAVKMGEDGSILVEVEKLDGVKTILARAVILALPPRIAAEKIEFSPPLPEGLAGSLMEKPTWMGGHAKVVAVYDRPFWRKEGLSGQAMSWAGPLQEIHDASPPSGNGALFGFFGIPAVTRRELGKDKVLHLVTNQLTRLFGPAAEKPISLLYKDWSDDPLTAVEEDAERLAAFPAYGPTVNAEIMGEETDICRD